ncbi:MAG: DUF3667 domain-containing protein [Flavobacterium sp.]|nr:DUF3667 domain-containing protein [Flavobacterium sp.]
MNEPELITCKNCGHQYEGYYCNICRQSADTNRITWKEILDHFFQVFIDVDRGFFYTAKELFLRPGITIYDYLQGKRIVHFNPIMFLILLGGIASVLFHLLKINLIVEKVNFDSMDRTIPILAHKYFMVIAAIMLVYLTLTDFILYRQKKYSVPELFISNTFQIGEILIFLIVFLPFLYLQKYINVTYSMQIEIRYFIVFLFICYLFLARYQLYDVRKNFILQLKIAAQLIILYVTIDAIDPLRFIMEMRK